MKHLVALLVRSWVNLRLRLLSLKFRAWIAGLCSFWSLLVANRTFSFCAFSFKASKHCFMTLSWPCLPSVKAATVSCLNCLCLATFTVRHLNAYLFIRSRLYFLLCAQVRQFANVVCCNWAIELFIANACILAMNSWFSKKFRQFMKALPTLMYRCLLANA